MVSQLELPQCFAVSAVYGISPEAKWYNPRLPRKIMCSWEIPSAW